jgi:hypothetical protein
MKTYTKHRGLAFFSLVLIWGFASSLYSPAVFANPLKSLTCEGDLPAFAVASGSYRLLKKEGMKTFEIHMKEASAVRIGARPERPHIEVKPWDRIQHEQFNSNVAEGVSVQFWSDGKTWFSVTERNKSLKSTRSLYCNVVTFQATSEKSESRDVIAVANKPDRREKITTAAHSKRRCRSGAYRDKCRPTS